MSFSSEVKEELSHVDGHEIHCKIAELAAIIGLCGRLQCEEAVSYTHLRSLVLWVWNPFRIVILTDGR